MTARYYSGSHYVPHVFLASGVCLPAPVAVAPPRRVGPVAPGRGVCPHTEPLRLPGPARPLPETRISVAWVRS